MARCTLASSSVASIGLASSQLYLGENQPLYDILIANGLARIEGLVIEYNGATPSYVWTNAIVALTGAGQHAMAFPSAAIGLSILTN
jgi:hypothetical protein